MIAAPGQLPAINATGNARLASAGTGDHGHGTFGHSWPPGTQRSAATIAVGTVIHSGPGTGAWATVVKDGPYRVHFVPGDPWARVTSIPGVAIEVAPAYVPMSTVTLVKGD